MSGHKLVQEIIVKLGLDLDYEMGTVVENETRKFG